MTVEDFPRMFTRTRGFRLGVPSDFTVAPDGTRALFLRSAASDDPVTSLWQVDVVSGKEQVVVDPRAMAGDDQGEMSQAERALRERMRQQTTGVSSYSTDAAVRRVVFTMHGHVWVLDLMGGEPVRLATPGPAMEARLDPTGSRVAYVVAGAVRVVDVDGHNDRAIAEPESPDVTYGLAEHVAAESMYRYQGYWWSPDGAALAIARVDSSAVQRWYIADPANPGSAPVPVRYPFAGTTNADVSLSVYQVDGSPTVDVNWDRAAFEYLVSVAWRRHGLHLVVQSRDQRSVHVLSADPVTGATQLVREDHDDAWVEVVRGAPATTERGSLVWIAASDDTWRLVVDGQPVTPPGLQVSEVSDVDGDVVLFAASDEPTEQHLWTWTAAEGARPLTTTPGVHSGRRSGGTTVVESRSLDYAGQRTTVFVGDTASAEIASFAMTPPLDVGPRLHSFGERQLRTAVLLPAGHEPGQRRPVLLDPYGGPHGLRVRKSRNMFSVSQWFADQGFAVLVIDGRGTPGRGPAWEHTVRGDKLTAPLQDQIDALHAAAEAYPDLDLDRVAIRGGSYGGYLAAAAVLRRPDVFHAAVAMAPVTDPGLYDTHWMERYLGHPDAEPENFMGASLIPDAPNLTRPLLLVHGIADDNVVVAHTLRLSQALLAAGRDHRILPLTGATHMMATHANLLLLEREFLLKALDPIVSSVALG